MTQPLCSAAFQPHQRYYELIRPCALHWYSCPWKCIFLGGLPYHQGDRFPRSLTEPEIGSRHLHAGHRPDRKQVSSGLVPGQQRCPVLMSGGLLLDASSVVHLRSSSYPTLDAFTAPFRRRSPPRLFTSAARRSLDPGPATRIREATLSSLLEHRLRGVRGTRRVTPGNLPPRCSQNRT